MIQSPITPPLKRKRPGTALEHVFIILFGRRRVSRPNSGSLNHRFFHELSPAGQSSSTFRELLVVETESPISSSTRDLLSPRGSILRSALVLPSFPSFLSLLFRWPSFLHSTSSTPPRSQEFTFFPILLLTKTVLPNFHCRKIFRLGASPD